MPQIAYAPRALDDLHEIWRYIAERTHSIEIADGVITRIQQTAESYAAQPRLGQPRPELGKRLRCFPVGNYIVFYVPKRHGIQIARVLHGARDVANQYRKRKRR
jgi:toxin ParE1/3/4